MALLGTSPAGAVRFATFRFLRCSRVNHHQTLNEDSYRFASLVHSIGPLLATGALASGYLAFALAALDSISGSRHRHECIAGLGAKHSFPASPPSRREAFLGFERATEPKQSSQPTFASGAPPAGQESRLP